MSLGMDQSNFLLGGAAGIDALQWLRGQRVYRLWIIHQASTTQLFVDVIDSSGVLWMHLRGRTHFAVVPHTDIITKAGSKRTNWETSPDGDFFVGPVRVCLYQTIALNEVVQ
jgi:hypothetical protein